MRLVLVAVGTRQPSWAEAAFADYAKRFPPELPLTLVAVKAEPRDSRSPAQLIAAEAKRIERALPRQARRIALDERGERLSTRQLADRLIAWQRDGADRAIVVGGPDGLEETFKEGCEERWRLSDLTLPHALVRVLIAEALYRAWTLTINHPYHRE